MIALRVAGPAVDASDESGEAPPPKLKRRADGGDEAGATVADESDAAPPLPTEDASIVGVFRVVSTSSEFRKTTRIKGSSQRPRRRASAGREKWALSAHLVD